MEYHKIETLYERDLKTFKVHPGVLKNRTYGLLKFWEWTEKIDGTNIRVTWDPTKQSVKFGGRSDNAQIHADLYAHLSETFTAEKMLIPFFDSGAVLYGEGYGAGIQKGGGLLSKTKKFVLFDVLVDGRWWLSHENVKDVASKLQIPIVPSFGSMTLEQASEKVAAGFSSMLEGADSLARAEGLVGRPTETLFDKRGARLITKLKTKDFV
jgi:hypothetical protein